MSSVLRVIPLDHDTWNADLDRPVKSSPFSRSWTDTLADLDVELAHLHACSATLEIDVGPESIANDQRTLRANKPAPRTGRVRLTVHRGDDPPMIYTMSGLYSFKHISPAALALRAIVLTLQALRAVDRYGVADRGQHYAGFKQLPAGTAMGGGYAGPPRDRAWAIAELQDITGMTSTDLADLFSAARYTAETDEARERVAAARAVISGQDAVREAEELAEFRRAKADGRWDELTELREGIAAGRAQEDDDG